MAVVYCTRESLKKICMSYVWVVAFGPWFSWGCNVLYKWDAHLQEPFLSTQVERIESGKTCGRILVDRCQRSMCRPTTRLHSLGIGNCTLGAHCRFCAHRTTLHHVMVMNAVSQSLQSGLTWHYVFQSHNNKAMQDRLPHPRSGNLFDKMSDRSALVSPLVP